MSPGPDPVQTQGRNQRWWKVGLEGGNPEVAQAFSAFLAARPQCSHTSPSRHPRV